MYFPKAAALMVAALLPVAATIAPASAAAVTDTFTLTGVAEEGERVAGPSGSFTITGTENSTSGVVTVSSISGTFDGSTIVGLTRSQLTGFDQITPGSTPIVNANGLGFSLANGADVVIFAPGGSLEANNLAADGVVELTGGLPNSFAHLTLTAAVPEPSTWAMMILGFCGLGFMAYRRKQGGSSFRLA
jgi:hypothetical protein